MKIRIHDPTICLNKARNIKFQFEQWANCIHNKQTFINNCITFLENLKLLDTIKSFEIIDQRYSTIIFTVSFEKEPKPYAFQIKGIFNCEN